MLLNYYFRFRPNIFLHVTLCTVDLCSCSSNLKLITFSWKLFVSFLLFVPFIRSSMLPFFFFFFSMQMSVSWFWVYEFALSDIYLSF
jgi:uncharacterized membrane protein